MAEWWDTIDWGTAPDWFAAVGTVGALITTLYIVLHDRFNKKRELADQVACTITWSGRTPYGQKTIYKIIISIYNHSPMVANNVMVMGPQLGIRSESRENREAMFVEYVAPDLVEMMRYGNDPEKEYGIKGLAPGESRQVVLEDTVSPLIEEFTLYFEDGHGQRWHRYIKSGKYIGKKKSLKLARHADQNSR